jgi:hypothetical protein
MSTFTGQGISSTSNSSIEASYLGVFSGLVNDVDLFLDLSCLLKKRNLESAGELLIGVFPEEEGASK